MKTPWWLTLARLARPEASGLAALVLLIVAGSVVEALRPWPMKLLIDYVLVHRPLPDGAGRITALPGGGSPIGLLGWLVGSTLLLFLAGQAITVVQGYLKVGVGNRLSYGLGSVLFDNLQRRSLRFLGRHRAGDLVQRVSTDSSCVRKLVMEVAVPALTSLASLVMMFGVMWQLDRSLALVALLAAPLLGALIRIFDGPMSQRAYHEQQLQGDMMSLAEQTLTSLPIVQAFNRESHEDARFRDLSRRTVGASLRTITAQLQFKLGTGAVLAGGTAALMAVGGFHVLQGTLTPGSLIVLLAYLASLYAPLETLAYLSSGFATASAGARRVLEVLEESDAVQEAPDAVAPSRPLRGHVRLENVTVGYESDRPVLRGVSLDAHPGEVVALVGPTGAGKSTLAALLPRFLDPWQGRVLLDGVDLRRLTLTGLRDNVALVLQEPFLLPLTVAENIAYGRPAARRDDVEAAANAANADDFIRRLPHGYDTVIGERGATLSGGQRQRIAIARALLKDAPVLVLDEPTSALDGRTEAAVMTALTTLMAGRTTFLIAHRLSTIRRADRIVVLDGGQVVEQGTHQQLLAAGGEYRSLYELLHHAADTAQEVAP